MTKSIYTIVSNINKLTATQKEFIAYLYDAILFNNGNLMFKADRGCLPQFQKEIIKLLEIELFRETIIEHIFLYEIRFHEEKLKNMKLAKEQENKIQEKTNEVKALKVQYAVLISISTIDQINKKTEIKTLLDDYYSAILNGVQCSSYLDSLYNFSSSSCDSYHYDSYDGTFYIPKEELKKWGRMQEKNNNKITSITIRCNEYDAQYINLQEQLSQLISNLQ